MNEVSSPKSDNESPLGKPEDAMRSAQDNGELEGANENRLSQFLENLAGYAESVQRKILWPLGLGVLATGYWLWVAYSAESALWWNITKLVLISMPVLIWSFVWLLLGQLKEAPTLAANLTSRPDSMLANLNTSNFKEKVGIRGLFSTLNAFRQEEGLDVVLDTIGSVTLIMNPLFALLASLMMVIIFILILITPLVLVF